LKLRRLLTTAAIGGAVVLSVTACGNDQQAKRAAAQAKAAHAKKAEQARQAREQAAAREKAQAQYAACGARMGEMLSQMSDLGSRLDVGLTYSQYSSALGDIKIAYDHASEAGGADAGALDCLTAVGLPAEEALNQYMKASSKWSDCIDDYSCSTDSIQPALQSRWTSAQTKIESAKSGLADMKDGASTAATPAYGNDTDAST
jgi:hypothetical protein